MQDNVKLFAQVQVEDIGCSSLSTNTVTRVIEGCQICHAQFDMLKPFCLSQTTSSFSICFHIAPRRICAMIFLGPEVNQED